MQDPAERPVPTHCPIIIQRSLNLAPEIIWDGSVVVVGIQRVHEVVNVLLNDRLAMHPPVSLGERLVIRDDLRYAVFVELAFDERHELVRR